MLGDTTEIFFTVDSSTSVERSFFSVARTTPFIACHTSMRMLLGDHEAHERQLKTLLRLQLRGSITLMPSDVAPAATALSAYSICTSFPLGLNVVREKEYCSVRQAHFAHFESTLTLGALRAQTSPETVTSPRELSKSRCHDGPAKHAST